MGCTFQGPNLAAQTVLPTVDVSIGISIILFSQLLGGAIFTSVASNVLDNELIKHLAGIPGVDPSQVLSQGATSLLDGVPASSVGQVLSAYNASLRTVFQVGLVMSCLVIFGTASMEWRSVKSKKAAADQRKKDADAAEKGEKEGGEEAAAAAAADTRSVETPVGEKHDWDSAGEEPHHGKEGADRDVVGAPSEKNDTSVHKAG